MVCNNPHCHVHILIRAVFLARKFFDFAYHSGEDIGVIIALLALKGHTEPLEAHSRVHIPMRQQLQRPVSLAVVLHKHEVPYFDYQMMSLVHQFCTRNCLSLSVIAQVHVDFGAGTAGTRVAHFPKIVVLVPEQHPVSRQVCEPAVARLGIESRAVFCRTLEHGCIKPVLVYLVHLGEQFPSPVDGFVLEIVPEAPVAEHLEHSVVICVMSYLFEVIVFSAHPQALLAVGSPRERSRAVAQEPVFELVHTGVGEHKCRVVLYDHRC